MTVSKELSAANLTYAALWSRWDIVLWNLKAVEADLGQYLVSVFERVTEGSSITLKQFKTFVPKCHERIPAEFNYEAAIISEGHKKCLLGNHFGFTALNRKLRCNAVQWEANCSQGQFG